MLKAGLIAAFGRAEQTYTSANNGDIDPVLNIGSSGVHDGDSLETSVTLRHQFDGGSLTVLGAYSAYEFQRDCDCDFSLLDLIRFDDNEDFEQVSLEVSYQSESADPFNYIAGTSSSRSDDQASIHQGSRVHVKNMLVNFWQYLQ